MDLLQDDPSTFEYLFLQVSYLHCYFLSVFLSFCLRDFCFELSYVTIRSQAPLPAHMWKTSLNIHTVKKQKLKIKKLNLCYHMPDEAYI